MVDDATLDKYFEAVHKLVLICGDIALNARIDKTTVQKKSCDVDLVTEIDKLVEETLVKGLSEQFPEHKFVGEESAHEDGGSIQLEDTPTWVIDPIDGTMNFVHGFPHFCISIACLINKVPHIGIVYNPTINQLFTAIKGRGAHLNGKKISVSDEKEISHALIMTEAGTSRDVKKMEVVMENYSKLLPIAHGMRGLGSAALNMCMVAIGGADANYEFGIHIWDIAAGQIIVEEAGGVCIDPAGSEFDSLSRRVLCASTVELANAIAAKLTQYYPPRD